MRVGPPARPPRCAAVEIAKLPAAKSAATPTRRFLRHMFMTLRVAGHEPAGFGHCKKRTVDDWPSGTQMQASDDSVPEWRRTNRERQQRTSKVGSNRRVVG